LDQDTWCGNLVQSWSPRLGFITFQSVGGFNFDDSSSHILYGAPSAIACDGIISEMVQNMTSGTSSLRYWLLASQLYELLWDLGFDLGILVASLAAGYDTRCACVPDYGSLAQLLHHPSLWKIWAPNTSSHGRVSSSCCLGTADVGLSGVGH
jgi:hypothetical protein